ncbi:MAG: gliding motility-associated C-terminal domain-containing protein, partial [Phaeodactylibacter sp.]|nr:gliding motility-associated C-terminal domain-containing protein [Phaeodactylibacter sp.]
ITDANGCPSLELTIPLDDPPSIEIDFTAISPVSCFQNQGQPCDGMATATASYSDGTAGTFNFSWSSGENELGVMSSTAMELCQDQQEVVVSDGTCSVTASIFIPAPAILAVGDDDLNNPSCFGSTDGSVSVTATGGTGPYTYNWATMDVGSTISNIGAGSYAVTITDNNMCEVTYIATLTQPAPLVGSLVSTGTVDSVSCFGEADAVVTVTAQGGNIPTSPILNFEWDPAIVPSPGNTDQATGLAAGTYSVTVSDILGCSDVVDFNISAPPPIQFDLGEVAGILCPGGTTSITVDTAFGGNGFNNLWYNFSVDNATGVPLGLPIEVFAGTHIITVTEVAGSGCSADTTIFIHAPADIILEYPPVVVVELGDSVILEPDALILAAPLDSIVWTPTTYLTFDSLNLLEPQVRPIESTAYTIQAFDINGCLVLAEVYVDVDKNRNVYIPNIFSPNGDGLNDYFQPFTGTGVVEVSNFEIYDRWGEQVHLARQIPPLRDEQPAYAWDGTFNGQKMNPGVYVYLIEVVFEDGQILLYRGSVTLIR